MKAVVEAVMYPLLIPHALAEVVENASPWLRERKFAAEVVEKKLFWELQKEAEVVEKAAFWLRLRKLEALVVLKALP